MFKSYFKSTIRNMLKNKAFTLINAVSLSLGIGASCLIMLFLKYELGYDSFHRNAGRIYRFVQILHQPGGRIHEASSPIHLADALVAEFPEVERAAPVYRGQPSRVSVGDLRFVEEEFLLSTQAFLDIFDVEFIAGDRTSALERPFSVIVTEEVAARYFGTADPLGEVLHFFRYGDFVIRGVIKHQAENSSLPFNMLLSENFEVYLQNVHPNYPTRFNSWNGRPCTTFALLREGSDAAQLEQRLPDLLRKYRGADWGASELYLQKLSDVHFGSANIRRNLGPTGSMTQLYAFATIALFILVLGCVNYVNLATARSVHRAKEVGLRKAVGATRSQIAGQFLGEAVVLTLIALAPGILLTESLLPAFNQLTGLNLAFDLKTFVSTMLMVIPVALAVGLLSGAYPALLLSKVQPAHSLKPRSSAGLGSRSIMRKVLVTFQFSLAVVLLIATLVVQRQLGFVSEKDLGFEANQVVVIEINSGNVRDHFETIKNEFAQHANVFSVTALSRIISSDRTPPRIEITQVGQNSDEARSMVFYGIGEDALRTLGLPLVEGENFGPGAAAQGKVLLNQTAAQLLGPGPVSGRYLTIRSERREYDAQVIGVVEDFHYRSLHEPIGPVVMGYRTNPIQGIDDILVKVAGGNLRETLAHLTAVHNRFDENQRMDFRFLDDVVQDLYESDAVFRMVFSIGAGLAVFIACLGLFGLTAYEVQQRTKEIGIRKALGASVGGILGLLYGDIFKLLLLSNVLAWPIAWFITERWLQNFAYRADTSWWLYGIAGLSALAIASATVAANAARASFANPVEALRCE